MGFQIKTELLPCSRHEMEAERGVFASRIEQENSFSGKSSQGITVVFQPGIKFHRRSISFLYQPALLKLTKLEKSLRRESFSLFTVTPKPTPAQRTCLSARPKGDILLGNVLLEHESIIGTVIGDRIGANEARAPFPRQKEVPASPSRATDLEGDSFAAQVIDDLECPAETAALGTTSH